MTPLFARRFTEARVDEFDEIAAAEAAVQAEVLLAAAFMLALPTLPERQLATIRQLAAKQSQAVRHHIEENWPKPVREAFLGPDAPGGAGPDRE